MLYAASSTSKHHNKQQTVDAEGHLSDVRVNQMQPGGSVLVGCCR